MSNLHLKDIYAVIDQFNVTEILYNNTPVYKESHYNWDSVSKEEYLKLVESNPCIVGITVYPLEGTSVSINLFGVHDI